MTATLPYLIKALAAWRLAHMFMYEQGPSDMLVALRAAFGVRHDDTGVPVAYPDGSVFACFLCFSVWVAAVLAVLPKWASTPFALSAAAIWSERWYNGSRK